MASIEPKTTTETMNHAPPDVDSPNPLDCPVVATLNLIAGKWKPMVLHILQEKPMRFGALKKLMLPISQKVLTEQLKELQSDGLVHREQVDGKIVSVSYSLTSYGASLSPVLDALYQWGVDDSNEPKL